MFRQTAIISLLLAKISLAQITPVKSPNFNEKSSSGNCPYYFQKNETKYTPTAYSGGGMPSADVMNNWDKMTVEQRNRVVMRMHGATLPPTQEEIAQRQQEALMNPQLNQPQLNEYEKLTYELVKDAYTEEAPMRHNENYYKTPEFSAKEQPFKNAAANINQMLSGAKRLSVKDAYYQMENAFGNTYMNYSEYNNAIKQNADFIKKWLVQNGYNLSKAEDLHLGIQKFMKDTLSITEISPDAKKLNGTKKHLPFRYDYIDFKGETDHRNYFITKAVATGYGQCNSLPGIYLVLAEALGVNAYLSFAPQHSFIRYVDSKAQIHNYEPTSNYKINDKWYIDHFHISNQAKASGIYLDTLNKKMIVASCLNDLSAGYMKKLGIADGKFIGDCFNEGIKYFPKGNNIYAYFIKSSFYSRKLERIMYEQKIQNINNISKSPEGSKYYSLLLENEKIIKDLGYQDMPEQQYLELMDMHDDRAKQQQEKKVTGKEKRSLFITN